MRFIKILIILVIVLISGCIIQTEKDILKIELKYGGGGTGGPWLGDDLIVLDIENNQIITTVYDGFSKTKSETSTKDYDFNQIYPEIENLFKKNGLTLNEYKRSKDCNVLDAAPGYVTVYLKDRTITVEEDFCDNKKPYAFFNGISDIYKNI